MIEVCCAIILKDSKILAVQRGLESSHPWKWEFPGGKIIKGETPDQCIFREIEEELSVQIVIQNELIPVEFSYETKKIRLIPFVCRIFSGEIYLSEHVAMQWITPDSWEKIDWQEADRDLILKNQKILRSIIEPKNF